MEINRHTLRAIRELKGLTIVAAAANAKIPQPNWSRLESGDEQPGWDRLNRIAESLSVPVDALVGCSEPATADRWPFRRGRKRVAS